MANILHLNDESLLLVLSNLRPCDLISLGKTCQRFANISSDFTLWTRVDCRSTYFDKPSLERVLDVIGANTQFLALDFSLFTKDCMLGNPLSAIIDTITDKCKILHTLILENVKFLPEAKPFKYAVTSLRYLSLKGSDVNLENVLSKENHKIRYHKLFPNLEVLILSDSKWLNKYHLKPIFKCTELRELRLNGCKEILTGPLCQLLTLKKCLCVKLHTLDMRGTLINHLDASYFNMFVGLRHLLLDNTADVPPLYGFLEVHDDTIEFLFDIELWTSVLVMLKMHVPMPPSPINLHTLVLRNFRCITDAALQYVSTMEGLRHLDLTGTGVTRDGIEVFKQRRPDVEVVWAPTN